MFNVKSIVLSVFLSIVIPFGPVVMTVLAGNLDSPEAPTHSASAMHTVEDIYNRLDAGTAGTKRAGVFTDPLSGPTVGTGHTLDEVMGKAPSVDDTSGADATDVLSGKTFWGLKSGGAWGTKTGTMTNVGQQIHTPTTTHQPITHGYHNGTGYTVGHPDLVAGNIKDGIEIFGVTGTFPSDGTAAAGEVKTGSTFYNSSASKVTGTGTKTLSAANDAVAAGYYAATTLSAVDTELAAGNIKSGVTIFGKVGSAVVATGTAGVGDVLATKTFSNSTSAGLTGTMPDRGAVTYTPTTTDQAVVAGFHNGSGKVEGDADLVPGNIKNGVDIFGVIGRLVDGSNATRVPKTGQTGCWDGSGTSETCTDTGQDGEYRLGVLPAVGPNLGVYGSYTVYRWAGIRFADNLDGTVTDNLTRLIWLKNANCFGTTSWATALSNSNGLADGSCSLTDSSSAGDWRLPNINELHSLVDPTQIDPTLPAGYPFTGVLSSYYWSSSTSAGNTGVAWSVRMYNAFVGSAYKSTSYYVWPVRSGN